MDTKEILEKLKQYLEGNMKRMEEKQKKCGLSDDSDNVEFWKAVGEEEGYRQSIASVNLLLALIKNDLIKK